MTDNKTKIINDYITYINKMTLLTLVNLTPKLDVSDNQSHLSFLEWFRLGEIQDAN